MLLKSIFLKDFRQFKHENTLEFSTDPDKNVSIILGQNGTGKTSLAQSFTWCLYGQTDFTDPVVLNKAIASNLHPKEKTAVVVEVKLVHSGTEYNIRRSQEFRVKNDGNLDGRPSQLSVAMKKKGQQEFATNPDLEIKTILPKELSGYFFINGEHIHKLTKELSRGKSKEFAEAVKNLLGLNAFLEAIDHLKPSKKHSVIGRYNEQFDGRGNDQITHLKEQLDKKRTEKSSVEATIERTINEIESGKEIIEQYEQEIRENEQSAIYQKKRDELRQEIARYSKGKEDDTKLLLDIFNKQGLSFFAKSLIHDALQLISTEKITDKGIPSIHQQTIDFVIDRGYCICGTVITPGEEIHAHLLDLLNYIPPKSIGLVVQDFVNESESLLRRGELFFDDFVSRLGHIRSYQNDMEANISAIAELDKLLLGLKDVGVIQSRLSKARNKLKGLEETHANLNKKLGSLESEIEKDEHRLSSLALQDSRNRKVETYKAHAQEIYVRLTNSYDEEETRVRQLLQESVNRIFREIYEGGMSISIDDKYGITVSVDELGSASAKIETSTAQSTSVIFAFIAGIIELAKNFSNAQGNPQELLAASEPYPLIMDAPLSNFDSRRIETVCNTLPRVAEQVIIMIKDTDGDLASRHMGSIIGRTYRLLKHGELETSIQSEK